MNFNILELFYKQINNDDNEDASLNKPLDESNILVNRGLTYKSTDKDSLEDYAEMSYESGKHEESRSVLLETEPNDTSIILDKNIEELNEEQIQIRDAFLKADKNLEEPNKDLIETKTDKIS
ncbi:942_t:CDS:2 [Dentiscutata erythropus]|uniref:942_t:CDS:1 n=1 Tax=Dentiscutata erythropus TaxID=1348616 RepID=A0A9N8ZC90_9GLOM|nr:942_t:CDS:2 [Dentiscutata erythropus]